MLLYLGASPWMQRKGYRQFAAQLADRAGVQAGGLIGRLLQRIPDLSAVEKIDPAKTTDEPNRELKTWTRHR